MVAIKKKGIKLKFYPKFELLTNILLFPSKMSTPNAQVPARVALGVTTLLAMSTTMASIQVNYDL